MNLKLVLLSSGGMLKFSRRSDSNVRKDFFVCVCGRELEAYRSNVRRGLTQSCGCKKLELMAKNRATHGCARVGKATPEYRTWASMLRRCTNAKSQNYKYYGGRGISVCKRWRRFEDFFMDMGPRPSNAHSIDRIDSDGNYEPGNCRWATALEQRHNRRGKA